MKWLEALKEWNSRHGGKWCIPKKGTKEHSEILALQHGNAPTKKGGNKSAGYIKLLVAKTQGKTVDDYGDEVADLRPKKSDRRINLKKMSSFSPNLLNTYGTATQKAQKEKTMTAKKSLAKANTAFVKAGFKSPTGALNTVVSEPTKYTQADLKPARKTKAKPTVQGTQKSIKSFFGKVGSGRFGMPDHLARLFVELANSSKGGS